MCPLKLKKMAHVHRNGKRKVACSACTVAQNQRTRVNVDCVRRTYCVVYGTRRRKNNNNKTHTQKLDFHYLGNKIHHFEICVPNNYENFGRVGSYGTHQDGRRETLYPGLTRPTLTRTHTWGKDSRGHDQHSHAHTRGGRTLEDTANTHTRTHVGEG